MAKELKAGETETVRLTKKTYRDAIGSINTAKERAREHNGVAAKSTKDFADDHALNPQALTTVARLVRKEPSAQQVFLRELIQGADYMGMFDQKDAFADDPIEIMRQVVDRADKRSRTDLNGAEDTSKAKPAAETAPAPVH